MRIVNRFVFGFALFALVLIVGCSGPVSKFEDPGSGVSANAPGTSPTASVLPSGDDGSAQPDETPKEQGSAQLDKTPGDTWVEAYTDALLELGVGTTELLLLCDVDRDGVPELFVAELGTVNAWITRGVCYTGGVLGQIVIPGEWMAPDLELYCENQTGELVWIAGGTMRHGFGEYSHEWYLADFSDFGAVRQTYLFGWTERFESADETWHYFIDTDEGVNSYHSVEEKPLSEVLSLQEQVFSEYEYVESCGVRAAVSDFVIGYDGAFTSLTSENADIATLTEYLSGWGSESAVNTPLNREPSS